MRWIGINTGEAEAHLSLFDQQRHDVRTKWKEVPMLSSTAFGLGQILGVLILLTIVGFAVRDQVRKRQGPSD